MLSQGPKHEFVNKVEEQEQTFVTISLSYGSNLVQNEGRFSGLCTKRWYITNLATKKKEGSMLVVAQFPLDSIKRFYSRNPCRML